MLNKEEVKQSYKQPIISNYEFNVIFERVIRHINYLSSQNFVSGLWDESLKYVERLVNHRQPQYFISTIINELNVVSGTCSIPNYNYSVRKKKILSLLMYISLYYLRRDDNIFNNDVIPKVKDVFDTPTNKVWDLKTIIELLKKLPTPNELCQEERQEIVDERNETNTKRNSNQLCIKVLIMMYEKIWTRLEMNGCNNRDKAEFLSAVSGYGVDVIEDRLSRNFDLTERDHRKDVDKANVLLKKMGIKREIKIGK